MTVMKPYSGTITGGYENLMTPQPGERANQGDMTLDLGSAKAIDQVALLYTESTGGAWRIAISNTLPVEFDKATNPNLYQTANLDQLTDESASNADLGYRHMFHMLPAPIVGRYVRLIFSSAVPAGVLAVGKCLQVESNADYGDTSWGFEEAPEPDTLDSGVTILEELPAAPYFEFAITWASEAEMETSWNRSFGAMQWKRRPLLVVRRPDPHAYRHSGIFWGILRLQPFVASDFDLFEVRGKIRSMV